VLNICLPSNIIDNSIVALIVRFELELGRELLLLGDSYWTANLFELVH
jgi:hypothetical protein